MYKQFHGSERQLPYRKTLIVRGSPPRTFASLLCFLALLLACTGAYLIHDVFVHPLQAGEAALLFAAFSLGLAVTLVYHLFAPVPGGRKRHFHRSANHRLDFLAKPSVIIAQTVVPTPSVVQARGIAGK
jgi:hypothetical protein